MESVTLTGIPALLAIGLVVGIAIVVLCILTLPAFLLSAFGRRKAEDYRRARNGTVVSQYDPPLDLSPAEMGYMYDLECGQKELRATLFDLEWQKVITINNQKSVTVINQDFFSKLKDYEQTAIKLFSTSSPAPSVVSSVPSPIASISAPVDFTEFEFQVAQSLRAKGYIMKSKRLHRWLLALVIAFVLGLWPMVLALASDGKAESMFSRISGGVFDSLGLGVFLFPIYIGAGYLMAKLWMKVAGGQWLAGKNIRQAWYEIEGYRLFIKEVDLDNIQFDATNSPNQAPQRTLAYAIALNLKTKWQWYFTSK
ncbi:MAG: hypothetical protein ABI220_03810 [Candidatus Saccharimonadales bacterium]